MGRFYIMHVLPFPTISVAMVKYQKHVRFCKYKIVFCFGSVFFRARYLQLCTLFFDGVKNIWVLWISCILYDMWRYDRHSHNETEKQRHFNVTVTSLVHKTSKFGAQIIEAYKQRAPSSKLLFLWHGCVAVPATLHLPN